MVKYFFYKLGQFLVNHLSLQASYNFALFLSDLQYFFSFRDRNNVRNNLKVILKNENNLDFHTREVFRNFGRYLTEFFRMAKIVDLDFIKKNVALHNTERLKEVLKEGRGGIIVTGHIGNWELGGVIMSLLGCPIMAVALPHKERPVNDLFNQQRESKGVTVIPSHLAIRKCLDGLQNNKLIALVADRDFSGKSGLVMDFLNRKAIFPKGPAIFSLKTGAPLIPSFLIRLPNHKFSLTIGELIYPPKVVDKGIVDDQLLLQMIGKYRDLIEEQIRKYPDQWLMFRPYWVNE